MKKIIGGLLILLAIGSIIYVVENFTFNFVALFVTLIFFLLLLIFSISEHKVIVYNVEGRKRYDYERSRKLLRPKYFEGSTMRSVWYIGIFGCLALYTLGNYFNADKDIYKNHDHHALRVEGVKIRENFVVAGPNDAFLDNPAIVGSIKVRNYDSKGVVLELHGVTTPIYAKTYDNICEPPQKYDRLNIQDRSLWFSAGRQEHDTTILGDTVHLYSGLGDQSESISFYITEYHDQKRPSISTDKPYLTLKYENIDSIGCYFFGKSITEGTLSSFSHFLTSGHELSEIAANVPVSMNLDGINLIRDTVYLNTKPKDRKKRYANRGYSLDLEATSILQYVKIGENPLVRIQDLRNKVDTIRIAYDIPFFIGFGDDKSNSVVFRKQKKADSTDFEVILAYELPKYQTLTSSEESKETTLMVTSSLIEESNDHEEESGLIENITENVLQFNLFENHNNELHLAPFYLSFLKGETNTPLLFTIKTSKNESTQHRLHVGEYLKGITSRNGETEWLVCIEDFKQTTPFTSKKMALTLIAATLLSCLSMCYSIRHKLYTGVEAAAHLILIAFLTIKLFLLWRVTVFPPLSSISFYEFNHFRDTKWLLVVICGALLFYSVTNLLKFIISSRKSLLKGRVARWSKILWEFTTQRADELGCQIGKWSVFCLHIILIAGTLLCPAIVYLSLGNHLPTIVTMIISMIVALPFFYTVIHLLYYTSHAFNRTSQIWIIILFIALLATLYLGIEMLLKKPMIRVLGGALLFFAIDTYVYLRFGRSYEDDISDPVEGSESGSRGTAFLLSVWNMICMSIATLVADGGYGIMFTLFMIFSFWVKIADLYKFESKAERKTILRPILYLLLLIAIVAIILLFKTIFLQMFQSIVEKSAWVFFGCAILGCLTIAGITMYVAHIRFSRWNLIVLALAAIAYCFIIFNGDFLGEKLRGKHMEYRARVQTESAVEILQSVQNESQQNKFLQASLNDWILYEYERIGKEVKPFGENGNGYFKIHPQSKLGAMWFAQTTDICLSRYIIAEHGWLLALLFIIAFAFFLGVTLRSVSPKRTPRIIAIQIALLFAVQVLMIFLANTRAFIFFGQDFPLISITSRLSAIYFFVLFIIAVCAALFGKHFHNYLIAVDVDKINYTHCPFGPDLDVRIEKRNKPGNGFIVTMFVISASLLYTVGQFNLNSDPEPGHKQKSQRNEIWDLMDEYGLTERDENAQRYYNNGEYNVDVIMSLVNRELELHVDSAFRSYQHKNGVPPLRRNMSDYVEELFNDSLMKYVIDSCCSKHTRRLLHHYREVGSKNNSTKNVICLRKVRSRVLTKGREKYTDTLEFVVALNYFNYKLPSKQNNTWRGHVIEPRKEALPDSTWLSYALIPSSISEDGEMHLLIKAKTGSPLTLVGSEALLTLDSIGFNVAHVAPSDLILVNGAEAHPLPLQPNSYFARNILLNGNRTFIYPHGHRMFWARDIAADYSRKISKNRSENRSDLKLTIDSRLNIDLYMKYKELMAEHTNDERALDKTVVVADGNGDIKAWVDYRSNKEYRINPNDFQKIAQISEQLFLNHEKGRTTESRYFGHFANNILRNGPGSTQKPIVWSAVTSKFNTGWWDDLKMKAPWEVSPEQSPNEYTRSGKDFMHKYYAGHRIESKFKSLYEDEIGIDREVDIRFYMQKSSNYYNSIMAYIGAFKKEELSDANFMKISRSNDSKTLFYQTKRNFGLPKQQEGQGKEAYKNACKNAVIEYLKVFPQMFINGRSQPVSFNKFLDKEQAMDTTSALLPKGLYDNFGVRFSRYRRDKETLSMITPPRFRVDVRKNRFRDKQLNEYMVRSVAIGSNTIWSVSPVNMAQMYGRLISMNKNYELGYIQKEHTDQNQYQFFDLDDSWRSNQDYLKVRKELLIGMSKVFAPNGTAHESKLWKKLIDSLDITLKIDDGNVEESDEDNSTFYIYGKTGTIDGIWGIRKNVDHLLATIITDKPLSQCEEKDLEHVKFYVIYQVDYTGKNWRETNYQIIECTLKSQAFKEYMGIK